MRRWAKRIFVTLSTLLLIGTVGIWVRAQWARETFANGRVSEDMDGFRVTSVTLDAFRGSAMLMFGDEHVTLDAKVDRVVARAALDDETRRASAPASAQSLDQAELGRDFGATIATRWGFLWMRWDLSYKRPLEIPTPRPELAGRNLLTPMSFARVRIVGVALPWWFLTLCFALAPACALWTWRRSRHRPPHACAECGYDLRATPDAAGPRLATCPECGRAAAAL